MSVQDLLSPIRSLTAFFVRLAGDRRGVAAVEFAFVVPILLSLYFVTMEVAQGIETNKKVGRVASMVADLVTQTQKTSTSELEAIMKIGEATLTPYNRSTPEITVTGIQMSPGGEASVAWSWKMDEDGKFGEDAKLGDPIAVPEDLLIENTFLVRVETHLIYEPMITWSPDHKEKLGLTAPFADLPMRETYFLRPRMSSEIPCDGCSP